MQLGKYFKLHAVHAHVCMYVHVCVSVWVSVSFINFAI